VKQIWFLPELLGEVASEFVTVSSLETDLGEV